MGSVDIGNTEACFPGFAAHSEAALGGSQSPGPGPCQSDGDGDSCRTGHSHYLWNLPAGTTSRSVF